MSQPRVERDVKQRKLSEVASGAGLVFAILYLAHVALQSPGPADGSANTVAVYYANHRISLLLSELLNGIGLIVFMVFLAALVSLLHRSHEQVVGTAVLVSGSVFIAMGLVSTASETALVRVVATGESAAVLTLFNLQAAVPVIFAVTAFTGTTALAVFRTRLLPRWLGIVGLAASAVFLSGATLSVFGTSGGDSSPIGPTLFIAWIFVLCAWLFRTSR